MSIENMNDLGNLDLHPNPEEALVDGLQSLNLPNFEKLMGELKTIAQAVGRYI